MLWKKSGETWTDEELMPVTLFTSEENISVDFKDGSSKTVHFK